MTLKIYLNTVLKYHRIQDTFGIGQTDNLSQTSQAQVHKQTDSERLPQYKSNRGVRKRHIQSNDNLLDHPHSEAL